MTKQTHVAVAIVQNIDGKILITKRAVNTHLGGLWEFPGGKRESDETIEQCLSRELKEELGIDIKAQSRLINIHHDYDDRKVHIDAYWVTAWDGQIEAKESQPMQWVEMVNLSDYPMPVANNAILNAMKLPRYYLITAPKMDDEKGFLQRLESALQAGIKLLQFRVFDLPLERRDVLLQASKALCLSYGATLLLNTDARTADTLAMDGLHLSSRELYRHKARPNFRWVAASCHTLADLQQAERLEVNFALLSPVLPTQSHPDAEPLGWQKFSELVRQVALPVYALGGMQSSHLDEALDAGAQGISGIRGFWKDV